MRRFAISTNAVIIAALKRLNESAAEQRRREMVAAAKNYKDGVGE